MRQTSFALVAVAVLMGLGAPIAEAGVTCKIIRSWCPSDNSTKRPDASVNNSNGNGNSNKTSVPEPGTLLLLAAGVSAAGAAVYRRRKNKKD